MISAILDKKFKYLVINSLKFIFFLVVFPTRSVKASKHCATQNTGISNVSATESFLLTEEICAIIQNYSSSGRAYPLIVALFFAFSKQSTSILKNYSVNTSQNEISSKSITSFILFAVVLFVIFT